MPRRWLGLRPASGAEDSLDLLGAEEQRQQSGSQESECADRTAWGPPVAPELQLSRLGPDAEANEIRGDTGSGLLSLVFIEAALLVSPAPNLGVILSFLPGGQAEMVIIALVAGADFRVFRSDGREASLADVIAAVDGSESRPYQAKIYAKPLPP